LVAAEQCLQRLIASRDNPQFASVAEGLRGWQARHNLAVIYRDQGRDAEAEAQWKAAIGEQPAFGLAWLGLGELYLAQNRYSEVEAIISQFGEEGAPGPTVLRARLSIARKDFRTAKTLLEEAIAQAPAEVLLWEILSHALLQEGTDWPAAERALRKVLQFDPSNPEAKRNLGVLLRQQGRPLNGAAATQLTLRQLYQNACMAPSDINEHLPTLAALAGQCRHVTEMGTRTGVSTTALLFAQPDKLVCYDVRRFSEVDLLQSLAGNTDFVFHQADVRNVTIEETDLLFIDTWHVYEQLKDELRLHAR